MYNIVYDLTFSMKFVIFAKQLIFAFGSQYLPCIVLIYASFEGESRANLTGNNYKIFSLNYITIIYSTIICLVPMICPVLF